MSIQKLVIIEEATSKQTRREEITDGETTNVIFGGDEASVVNEYNADLNDEGSFE